MATPKSIATYWDDLATATPLHHTCWSRARDLHPDWTFTLYTNDLARTELGLDEETMSLHPSILREHVKLAHLEKTGGAWMDAGVFLSSPVDDIFDVAGEGVQAYRASETSPVESWLMVVRDTEDPFIAEWRDRLRAGSDTASSAKSIPGSLAREHSDYPLHTLPPGTCRRARAPSLPACSGCGNMEPVCLAVSTMRAMEEGSVPALHLTKAHRRALTYWPTLALVYAACAAVVVRTIWVGAKKGE